MITEIAFEPGLAAEVGLVPVKMERLGKLVLLVGPNGHGKTRTMRLVQAMLSGAAVHAMSSKPWDQQFVQRHQATMGRLSNAQMKGREPELRRQLLASAAMTTTTRPAADERAIGLEYALGPAARRADMLTSREFQDVLRASRGDVNLHKTNDSIEVSLTQAARVLFAKEHPRSSGLNALLGELRRVNEFDKVVQALLGSPIDYDIGPSGEPVPVLLGRRFEFDELSRGQRVLLCWAHMLSQQHEELASSIIFFDEPELHLHPDACWQAISRLMSDVLGEHSQIWLATHSLPLVASACAAHGLDSLFYVHGGKVEFAGNRIETVLGGLLGGADQRETLNTFLGEVDALAFHQFAAECLIMPTSVELRGDDPQGAQVTGLLRERLARGPVALLEYGAGRGRLAMATSRVLALIPAEIQARLTYATYHHLGFAAPDEVRETSQALTALAAQHAQVAMYFDQPPPASLDHGAVAVDELRACSGTRGRKFELVLMANTLHEIPVTQWQPVFDEIAQVMAPGGELLIVEDQRPRIGELPHGQGFLVLDRHELRELFDSDAIRGTEQQGGRLTAYAVPREALRNVSADTIHAALDLLERRALAAVERLRTRGDSSARGGREHALYAMMSVNAQLTRKQIPRAARPRSGTAAEATAPPAATGADQPAAATAAPAAAE